MGKNTTKCPKYRRHNTIFSLAMTTVISRHSCKISRECFKLLKKWRSTIFARLIFAWIYFCGCKFCHISCEFIFAFGEISIILAWTYFPVYQICNVYKYYDNIGGKQIFAKLPKMYQLNQCNSPLYIIQSAERQNYSF